MLSKNREEEESLKSRKVISKRRKKSGGKEPRSVQRVSIRKGWMTSNRPYLQREGSLWREITHTCSKFGEKGEGRRYIKLLLRRLGAQITNETGRIPSNGDEGSWKLKPSGMSRPKEMGQKVRISGLAERDHHRDLRSKKQRPYSGRGCQSLTRPRKWNSGKQNYSSGKKKVLIGKFSAKDPHRNAGRRKRKEGPLCESGAEADRNCNAGKRKRGHPVLRGLRRLPVEERRVLVCGPSHQCPA